MLCVKSKVFVGRPMIWGITVDGESGAKKVLEILRDELDLTMALSGVADVNEVSSQYVNRRVHFSSKL
jgi:isopentenyl diphosphate isomerase/L-lactate dehydrogenase-like FMN-dependent dehydrogenase